MRCSLRSILRSSYFGITRLFVLGNPVVLRPSHSVSIRQPKAHTIATRDVTADSFSFRKSIRPHGASQGWQKTSALEVIPYNQHNDLMWSRKNGKINEPDTELPPEQLEVPPFPGLIRTLFEERWHQLETIKRSGPI